MLDLPAAAAPPQPSGVFIDNTLALHPLDDPERAETKNGRTNE